MQQMTKQKKYFLNNGLSGVQDMGNQETLLMLQGFADCELN